jgi:gliding motility-associated-like protein
MYLLSTSTKIVVNLLFLARVLCLITFVLSNSDMLGQNLVPNPSFEDYKQLRCKSVQDVVFQKGPNSIKYKAAFDSILYDWTLPTNGASDVFSVLVDSTCETNPKYEGYGPLPKDGFNMIRLFLLVDYGFPNPSKATAEGRSYVQVRLTDKLNAGQNYFCGWYQALAKDMFACNDMGMLFTRDAISSDSNVVLNYHPQINESQVDLDTGWKLYSGCFTAIGDEQYLTMGGFYDDLHVIAVEHLFPYDGTSDSEYLIDSVFVEPVPSLEIPNVITPNGDCCNEKFVIGGLKPDQWSLSVYNRWGTIVHKSNNYKNDWGGDNLSDGVYFYLVQYNLCSGIRYKGTLSIIH